MLAHFAFPATVGLLVALTGVEFAPSATAVPATGCRPDAKLIGLIELSSDDRSGTWWRLTREGFDAAGITDYKAFIEGAFGVEFASLSGAVDALVASAAELDFNTNGYVCAYNIRGTRTNYGDPNFANYFFMVRDDGHGK